jgi:elongation factor P
MITSNQLAPGMTLSIDGKIYRVESCVKVTVAKGVPFIKTKLKRLPFDEEVVERNFKLNQLIEDVSLSERRLEYLYLEGKDYLCLDIGNLEQVLVPSQVIADKVDYLKEGIELKAMFYGNSIFAVELPQFLELMVVKTEESESAAHVANAIKLAILETGAKVEVPMFIESGDIIKVDTQTNEYIQRV